MKIHPSLTCCLIPLLFVSVARAEEKALRELLRNGLFEEEVSHDTTAAAKSYEELLERFGEERAFAASALFRLAEVRRKQDRKDEAIRLYQRLLTEFPQAENEARLGRENLIALGGKLPEVAATEIDAESREIARLQGLSKTSPDLLRDPATLDNAIRSNSPRTVAFLLSAGAYPFGGISLRMAAGEGNLAIVKQLLAAGGKVPEAIGQEAVSEAANKNRAAVLEFLLESGIQPTPKTLCDVIWRGDDAKSELLLKHGADPNGILPALNGSPSFTLLNYLLFQEAFGRANWLLDHGAKPDVADDATGLRPLHYAAKSTKPGNVELLERLLKAGADANRVSASKSEKNKNISYLADATPLDAAFQSGFEVVRKARLLLAHGANPNHTGIGIPPLESAVRLGDFELAKLLIEAGADLKKPGLLKPFLNRESKASVEKLRFLLENGVDPNIPDGIVKRDQTEDFSDPFLKVTGKIEEYPDLPIYQISFPTWRDDLAEDEKMEVRNALELCLAMLTAGAKTGPLVGFFLERVGMLDEKGDVFRALLAQSPSEVSIKAFQDMARWRAVPRKIYLDEALIPALSKLPSITLLEPATGKRTMLAEGASGKGLPTTLELLRDQIQVLTAVTARERSWPELTLVRVEADGTLKREPFDLEGDSPLPETRAGDVWEVVWGKPTGLRGGENYQIFTRYNWCLNKRVSFPITLEADGKAREIVLRGDLLAFDPTKDEAPRVDAASLIALFVPDAMLRQDSLVVKREGWNDIRLGNGVGYPLQKGDRLVFETQARDVVSDGSKQVTLQSPGLPFSKQWIVKSMNGKDAAAMLPTLVQVITDAYAPKRGWEQVPRENSELFPWAAAKVTLPGEVPVVLPHPDFSAIRIQRKSADGKESWMEVDLAKSMRECDDATSPEKARSHDVTLMAGDVVELPILVDRKGQPWMCFSPEESRFFSKVLAGRILINRGQGTVEQQEIFYQNPELRMSEHGLLPLPPVAGIASTRLGSFITENTALIRREGIGIFEAEAGVFVRDGDQIDLKGSFRVSRPRVVPQSTMNPVPQPVPQPGVNPLPQPLPPPTGSRRERVVPPPVSSE